MVSGACPLPKSPAPRHTAPRRAVPWPRRNSHRWKLPRAAPRRAEAYITRAPWRTQGRWAGRLPQLLQRLGYVNLFFLHETDIKRDFATKFVSPSPFTSSWWHTQLNFLLGVSSQCFVSCDKKTFLLMKCSYSLSLKSCPISSNALPCITSSKAFLPRIQVLDFSSNFGKKRIKKLVQRIWSLPCFGLQRIENVPFSFTTSSMCLTASAC